MSRLRGLRCHQRKLSCRVPSHGSSSHKQVIEAPQEVVPPTNPASHPNPVRRKRALGPLDPHHANRDRTCNLELTTFTIEDTAYLQRPDRLAASGRDLHLGPVDQQLAARVSLEERRGLTVTARIRRSALHYLAVRWSTLCRPSSASRAHKARAFAVRPSRSQAPEAKAGLGGARGK